MNGDYTTGWFAAVGDLDRIAENADVAHVVEQMLADLRSHPASGRTQHSTGSSTRWPPGWGCYRSSTPTAAKRSRPCRVGRSSPNS